MADVRRQSKKGVCKLLISKELQTPAAWEEFVKSNIKAQEFLRSKSSKMSN